MSKKTDKPESTAGVYIVCSIAAFLVIGLWGYTLYRGHIQMPDNASADFLTKRGTFGDMFGAVNALFSGLAFVGIIFTIMLQRKELELQRNELSLTRRVMNGQKQEMAAQNATLVKQNFENTFFAMLRLHHELINAMDSTNTAGTSLKGRDSFNGMYSHLKHYWDTDPRIKTLKNDEEKRRLIYERLSSKNESDMGPHYRSTKSLLDFIAQSQIGNKPFYYTLVRDAFTNYELILIFYGCLARYDEAFKKLIEEAALFKNLNNSLLLDATNHAFLYTSAARG